MELKLLTELLGLPGCVVKDIIFQGDEILIAVEVENFPVCPRQRLMNF